MKLRQCTHTKATNPQTAVCQTMATGVSCSALLSWGCHVKFYKDSGDHSRYPSESSRVEGWEGGRSPRELMPRLGHQEAQSTLRVERVLTNPSSHSVTITQLQGAWVLAARILHTVLSCVPRRHDAF